MNKTLIVYTSKDGSCAQYVLWLAQAINADVVEYKKLKKTLLENYTNIIYGAPLRMNKLLNYAKFISKFKVQDKLQAVLAVGFSPQNLDTVKAVIEDNNISNTKVFYLKGRFIINDLKSKTERSIMKRVCHALMLREDLSAQEKYLLKCAVNPIDNLMPLNLLPLALVFNTDAKVVLENINYTPKTYDELGKEQKA